MDLYSSDQISCQLLVFGWEGNLKTGRHAHAPPSIFCLFKNIQSDWSYECATKTVNVSARGVMLPGQSQVSLEVALLCWPQMHRVGSHCWWILLFGISSPIFIPLFWPFLLVLMNWDKITCPVSWLASASCYVQITLSLFTLDVLKCNQLLLLWF